MADLADRELPSFREHSRNIKLRPLDEGVRAPSEVVRRFVRATADALGRPARDVRVLDVGCGRGNTVAWLCGEGFDAYGVNVVDAYLEMGRGFLSRAGHGDDRLRGIDDDRYPFADRAFDVVLSDQVLEHVADLDALAAEVARVSAPGSEGLHVFPARWRPVEVHMHAPFVHWLPKGAPRRAALRAALGAGAAAPYFTGLPLGDRVEVFARYSDLETFYRPLGEIRAAFGAHGMRTDVAGPAQDAVARRAPGVPPGLRPVAGLVYRNVFSVCLRTYGR